MRSLILLLFEFVCLHFCLGQLRHYNLEEGDLFTFSCHAMVHPMRLMFDPVIFAVSKGGVMHGIAVNEVLQEGTGFKIRHYMKSPENKTVVLEISKHVDVNDTGEYTCGTKVHSHTTVSLKVKKGDIGQISFTMQKITALGEPVGSNVTIIRYTRTADPKLKEVNLTSGLYRLTCVEKRTDLNVSYVIFKNGMKVGNKSTVNLTLDSVDRTVGCRLMVRDKFQDSHTVGFSTSIRPISAPKFTCMSSQVENTPGHWICNVTGVTCDDVMLEPTDNRVPKGYNNDVTKFSCETDKTSDVIQSVLHVSETTESFFIKVRTSTEDFRYEIKAESPRYSYSTSTGENTLVSVAVVTVLILIPIATVVLI